MTIPTTRLYTLVKSSRGFTLIETLIAMTILLIGLVAVMDVFTVSISQNTNQGEFAMRNTQYAQDKMEQLLALHFLDSTTDTTVYPPGATGGTGLGAGLTAGGMVGSTCAEYSSTNVCMNPAPPVDGYADYLDASGNLLPNSNNWFYKRQWSIALDSSATLKTITVISIARARAGRGVIPITTTLICYKSDAK